MPTWEVFYEAAAHKRIGRRTPALLAVRCRVSRKINLVYCFPCSACFACSAVRFFVQGIMTVYVVSVGLMMVFVLVMTVLGMLGNGIRRMLPPARPMMRLLRSRKFTAVAACVAVVAAHVETFSLPPAFREITLKGEQTVTPEHNVLAALLVA